MANKKNVEKQSSLDEQKQAQLSLDDEMRKTAKGALGQELITPLVMEEDTALQNPHIFHKEERPGLHASSLKLEEPIDGSRSTGYSQASASHSSWIDTKRGVFGEESPSHATLADSASYRFPCPMIHSVPNCQFLGMKNCQVATQEQVLGDTETVYTGSVGHQGCSTMRGMQNLEIRSHDDTQSALYEQMWDQNSWINSTLEASRMHLDGMRFNESRGDTQSDEPLGLTSYFNSMNCMHHEMENGSEESVTEKNVPVGNQVSGILFTTQDMQGIYENYGDSSNHNVGKVQRQQRSSHSMEPYSKMTKKARELLKKKQIKEQLDFVENFHGICPILVYVPAFSTILEDENMTPLSPSWPGK